MAMHFRSVIVLLAALVVATAVGCGGDLPEPILPPPNPELAQSYFERAMANTYLGKYELSIQDFDKANQINPTSESYLNRGGIEWKWRIS